MHLPPQAAGPDRHLVTNHSDKPTTRKPRTSAKLKPQSSPLLAHRKRNARPKAGR
ncbi:replication protein [Escherichia coli]|nr:replication protein [Escherichia coli]